MNLTKHFRCTSTNGGFTLTEIAVTLAIIGILAVSFAGYSISTRATKNMSADGRDLYSAVEQAKLEAVRRGECVGLTLQPGAGAAGGYIVFLDNGANSCNGNFEAADEQLLRPVTLVRENVALVRSGVNVTAADPGRNDLFDSISFDPRSFVAARVFAGADSIILQNSRVAVNATWNGRVVVSPGGAVEYQSNNDPAVENRWSP